LVDGAHEWVEDVVAYTAQGAKAYHLAGAFLRTVSTDGIERRVEFWQSQVRPDARRLEGTALVAGVFFISPAVVEEIVFEQLDALVFEIQQSAIDAAVIGAEEFKLVGLTLDAGWHTAAGPVLRPVDPRSLAPRHRRFAAATTGRVFRHFAEKSSGSIRGNVAKSAKRICDTTTQSRGSNLRVNSEQNCKYEQAE
jgi:hypothetical protein